MGYSMTVSLLVPLLGPPFLAFFGAVAAWRVGTRTVVPTILLGWVLSSLFFDALLRGPETDRVPSAYFIPFFFYAWPFLRLGRELRKEAVDETLSLGSAAPIALIATANVLLSGMFALLTACNVGVWHSGCAEMLAVWRDWDQ
jgi:hypothetical protein